MTGHQARRKPPFSSPQESPRSFAMCTTRIGARFCAPSQLVSSWRAGVRRSRVRTGRVCRPRGCPHRHGRLPRALRQAHRWPGSLDDPVLPSVPLWRGERSQQHQQHPDGLPVDLTVFETGGEKFSPFFFGFLSAVLSSRFSVLSRTKARKHEVPTLHLRSASGGPYSLGSSRIPRSDGSG